MGAGLSYVLMVLQNHFMWILHEFRGYSASLTHSYGFDGVALRTGVVIMTDFF